MSIKEIIELFFGLVWRLFQWFLLLMVGYGFGTGAVNVAQAFGLVFIAAQIFAVAVYAVTEYRYRTLYIPVAEGLLDALGIGKE